MTLVEYALSNVEELLTDIDEKSRAVTQKYVEEEVVLQCKPQVINGFKGEH